MNRLDAATVPLAGVHLVEASAGTGKTYAITTLYLRAVIELGLMPDRILVVTFTRAATAELRERIRSRLRGAQDTLREVLAATDGASGIIPTDECLRSASRNRETIERALGRLSSALLVIDEAAVLTIHGFCGRVLESNAFESRVPTSLELVESTDDLVEEIIVDFMVQHLATGAANWLACVQRRGLELSSLKQLSKTLLAHSDALLLPGREIHDQGFDEALAAFEVSRRYALEWLAGPDSERHLLGLQKTKRGGLGSRLRGYVDKCKSWLGSKANEISGPCEHFERLRELAEQNSSQVTSELSRFLEMLGRSELAYEKFDSVLNSSAIELRHRFAEMLFPELERRKAAQRVQSYDDLLARLRDALRGTDGDVFARTLRQKYPLALIDEFQDTDPIQYEVFSRIYSGDCCLFMIGDPKQSIYAFRGADVDNYLRAANVVGSNRYTLSVNYRSDPSLVLGLDGLFGGHPDPFCGSGIEFVRVVPRPLAVDGFKEGSSQSGVRIVWFEDPANTKKGAGLPKYRGHELALAATVDHCKAILSTGSIGSGRPVRPSDIAVLSPTNRGSAMVAKALRAANLRCIETTDGSVLASESAVSLIRLMRALCRLSDLRALATVLLDPLFGLQPHELPTLDCAEIEQLDVWTARMARFAQTWARSGVLSMLEGLLEELDVPVRILATLGGERWLTDLVHVTELVQSAASRQRLTPVSQLDWLLRARVAEEHCSLEERQLRVESDSQAVFATTIHRSKGLEFPFVICPFLWDSSAEPRNPSAIAFRRREQTERGVSTRDVIHLMPRLLDEDGEEFAGVRRQRLAESSRLAYVALTRAKHQVTFMMGPVTGVTETAIGRMLFRRNGNAGNNSELSLEAIRLALESPYLRIETASRRPAGDGETDQVGHQGGDVNPSVDALPRAVLHWPAPFRRQIRASAQITSFSGILAQSDRHATKPRILSEASAASGLGPDWGRDVDALSRALQGFGTRESGQSAPLSAEADPMMEAMAAAGHTTLPLASLPNGPRTGEALHALFEEMDFETFEADSDLPNVGATLRRFGVREEIDIPKVQQGIRSILDVSLLADAPELKLRRVSKRSRRVELEFMLRLAKLDAKRLGALLGSDMTGMPENYRDELVAMGFEGISGYLRGFIDLVFELDGRFYIVDYKSNWLGNSPRDYLGEALRQAMMSHHYPVQAAIYSAAVDRWLQTTQSGYEYDRHFGGVLYLFLRGMHPCFGAGAGVFHHRPEQSAMLAMSRGLLGDEA